MVKSESLSKEWLSKFERIDTSILERMVNAFLLAEALKSNGLNFIFKGGTSLSLLFSEPKRFSIDIDIITQEESTKIEQILEDICKHTHFIRYELDERRSFKNGISKAHYKLFFNSSINDRESYVLLDILFEENSYTELLDIEIKNRFVITDYNPIKLQIPSFNSFAGDKLTAFAPHTIGIPLGIDKELEIAKQLFDIGNIFDNINNYEIASNTYLSIAQKEINYRELDITISDSLDDTINTSLIWSRNKNVGSNLEIFNDLEQGRKSLTSYLTTSSFTKDAAIESVAKAALLAIKIKSKNLTPLEPFDENTGIKKYMITKEEYNFLNKLKNLPNKALYYWFHAIELL